MATNCTQPATIIKTIDKSEDILGHLHDLKEALSKLSQKEETPPPPTLLGVSEIERIVSSTWDSSLGDHKPWMSTITRMCVGEDGSVAMTNELLLDRLDTTMACIRINQNQEKQQRDVEIFGELQKLSSSNATMVEKMGDMKDAVISSLKDEITKTGRKCEDLTKMFGDITKEKENEFYKAFACGYRAAKKQWTSQMVTEDEIQDVIREFLSNSLNQSPASRIKQNGMMTPERFRNNNKW